MLKKISILFSCVFILCGCFHQTITVEGITSNFYNTHKSQEDTYYLFYDKQDIYNEKIYQQLLPVLTAQHIKLTENIQEAQYALTFHYQNKDYSYTTTETNPVYGYNAFQPYSYGIIGYSTSNDIELEFAHGIIISAYKINRETLTTSDKLWDIFAVTSTDHSEILKTIPYLLQALQKHIATDTQGRYRIVISFDNKIISEKKLN